MSAVIVLKARLTRYWGRMPLRGLEREYFVLNCDGSCDTIMGDGWNLAYEQIKRGEGQAFMS